MQQILRASFLVAAVAAASACVEADEELGTEAAEINGDRLNGGNGTIVLAGVMRIEIAGDTRVRTGVQIGPDLVLTSSRWVTASTSPSSITVSNGAVGGTNVQSRTAAYVTVNPYLPVAIIQVTQAFATSPVIADTRTAAQLASAHQAVSCYAYRTASDFRRAGQEVLRTDGAREYIVGPDPDLGVSTRLDDWDAGAPCFDGTTSTWVGFALSSPGMNETRVFGASHINFFVENMRRVATARRTLGWSPPFMVQTVAPNGSNMCLDVASGNPYNQAAVNQYPCHGGGAQRWLLDFTNANGPAFLNVVTGTCLDVRGFSTTAGESMQTYTCNGGTNQAWVSRGNGNVLPGDTLSPMSSPTTWTPSGRIQTLCLSVRGGASNTTQPVEQATCVAGAAHQDWYLGYAL